MSVANAPFTVAPSGYQLPVALKLGAVRLQVANLNRSIAYYERVVGLRVIHRDDTHAAMGTESSTVALVHLHEKEGVQPVPARGRLGLYHFAILLPTRAALGQFLAHLRDLGVRAGMSDHLVSEALYLTDPDGLGIEVYADRPRESWKVQGSAVAMATDPLDVPGLLQAAGATKWSGAPEGTRIGHVHLYVGDLAQSAAFFHEALGFDKVTLQFPGALFLSAGGYHHHLGTNIWAAGSPPATDDDARLLEWNVLLPTPGDVHELIQSLTQHNVSVVQDAQGVVATDPWGTNVRITAHS